MNDNRPMDAGNGMHSAMLPPCGQCGKAGPCEHHPQRLPAVNGVNACLACNRNGKQGDPRVCGHFNDDRDYYGPFEIMNWMSRATYESSVEWCSEHIDQVQWTLKVTN